MFDRCCQSSPTINEFGGLRYVCVNGAGHSDHHRSVPEYNSSWDADGWIVKDGVRVRKERALCLAEPDGYHPCKLTSGHSGPHACANGDLCCRWGERASKDQRLRGHHPDTPVEVSVKSGALAKPERVFQHEWIVVSEGNAIKELIAARATVDRAVRFFSGMSLDRCSTEDQRGFLIHLRALMDIAQPGNANAEMIAKGKK